MTPRRPLAVFCGPSLPAEVRYAAEGVDYLPPASRGDVKSASEHYEHVLLLDGTFHHRLAPAPKEIFEALGRCALYGASSMGALRAVECAPYGAIPLGIIARWYSSGRLDGDDEVAVAFDPVTERALSVPVVNVRYLAWLAHRRGIFTLEESRELVAAARKVFYWDRDWNAVMSVAPRRSANELRPLAAIADLKSHDAIFALRRVMKRLGTSEAP